MALLTSPDGKRPRGRPRSGNEDSIQVDIKETMWKGVNWIDVV
jgi:hypothetical protein